MRHRRRSRPMLGARPAAVGAAPYAQASLSLLPPPPSKHSRNSACLLRLLLARLLLGLLGGNTCRECPLGRAASAPPLFQIYLGAAAVRPMPLPNMKSTWRRLPPAKRWANAASVRLGRPPGTWLSSGRLSRPVATSAKQEPATVRRPYLVAQAKLRHSSWQQSVVWPRSSSARGDPTLASRPHAGTARLCSGTTNTTTSTCRTGRRLRSRLGTLQ